MPNSNQIWAGVLCMLLMLSMGQVANAQYKSFVVDSYRYDQFSSSGESSIDLYNQDKKLVGILVFLPVDASLLPSASIGNDGIVRLYYVAPQLSTLVDMLRHESPVVLNHWLGSGNNSHVGTQFLEPIGEAE